MQTLPSGLPDTIDGQEDLARFLTQSSHFVRDVAKASAFLPSAIDRATSVSRHGETPLESLWVLGLAAAGERKLYGAAVLKAICVREAELDVASDEPPPRHAVITGWPWTPEDPELQKARQKEKALLLASKSKLVLR